MTDTQFLFDYQLVAVHRRVRSVPYRRRLRGRLAALPYRRRRSQLLRHPLDLLLRLLRSSTSNARSRSFTRCSTIPTCCAQPILGGELSYKFNLTSLTRQQAEFDAINQNAVQQPACAQPTIPPIHQFRELPAARHRRHLHALFRRGGLAAHARHRQRPDDHAVLRACAATSPRSRCRTQPGISNYINTGETELARAMPDCRRRISLSVRRRGAVGHADDRADRAAHRAAERNADRQVSQRRRAEPGVQRQQSVLDRQILRLGPRRRRRPRQCRLSIHRAGQQGRLVQRAVRAVLPDLRRELLLGPRPHQYRPGKRSRQDLLRLCRTRHVSAEPDLLVHRARPVLVRRLRSGPRSRRRPVHAATPRIRSPRQFRPLDAAVDVRRLCAPALGSDS